VLYISTCLVGHNLRQSRGEVAGLLFCPNSGLSISLWMDAKCDVFVQVKHLACVFFIVFTPCLCFFHYFHTLLVFFSLFSHLACFFKIVFTPCLCLFHCFHTLIVFFHCFHT